MFIKDDVRGVDLNVVIIVYTRKLKKSKNHNKCAKLCTKWYNIENYISLSFSRSNIGGFYMAGKQLDATRQELFITLKYLLDNCYDEEHTSKTVDLMNYAKEHYRVLLDRRRVNSILEFLADLPNTFPDILPFTIKKVERKPRYYIEKSYFSKHNARKISEAIFKDYSLSASDAKRLVNLFLDKVCSAKEKEKLLNDFTKKERRVIRPSQTAAERFSKMDEIIERRAAFFFRPKTKVSLDACSNISVHIAVNKLIKNAKDGARRQDELFVEAMAYSFAKETDVCLYLPDYDGAVIIDFNNILIKPNSNLSFRRTGESFELRNSKFASIDEMIDLYYAGGTGQQINIHFKYVLGTRERINNTLVDKMKDDFRKYFKKELEYTLEERDEVEVSELDGEERHRVYIDLHGRVECNYSSFKNWYWKHGWFEHLVIVEPNYMNNQLLTDYINRFTRRLEKYGETPEQREERIRIKREEREEAYRRLVERRRQRLAEQNANNNDGGN